MSKAKQPVGKVKSSPSSNISGVKFFKAFAPSIRRRRQCDKEKLEIYNFDSGNNEGFNVWDTIPASPITPPAAFLPPDYNYRRSGKKNPWTIFQLYLRHPMQMRLDLKNFTIVILLLSEVLSSEKKGRKNQFKVPVHCAASWKKSSRILFILHCDSSCWRENYLILPLQAVNTGCSLFSWVLTVGKMLEKRKEKIWVNNSKRLMSPPESDKNTRKELASFSEKPLRYVGGISLEH